MGWLNGLRLMRARTAAVPPGAERPSTTLWWNPGGQGVAQWSPASGMFETHWDWGLSGALAVPAYWRGRQLISQSIGAMPLAAWQGLERVEPTPMVLREPCPGEDRCVTVAAWVADLLDHGNAFGLVDRGVGRSPTITPLPATNVRVGRDPVGQVVYEVGSARFAAGDVFHAKGVLPYPGALRGLGVLEAGLGSLTRMASEDAYAARAFTSGVPSGLIRVKDPDLQPGSPDDPAGYASAHGIKRSWRENIQTGDVAVLSDLVDFTPLSWSPTDAQLVEARQLSMVDVANLLNLDPYWVGSSQTSAPYQNVQDAAVQLARFGLSFWITVLEAQLSRLLIGQEARFNRDTILRDSPSTRVANNTAYLGAGVLTVDEVRALEGLPPLPQADLPANVSPLFPAAGDEATNEPAGEA